jgi:threonine dehydratase
MEWQAPTLADVLKARRRILRHLHPTPLFGYASLDELLGAEVLVKHENHQPVGAFKVRGGVNLISQLRTEERKRGVITASTGNHGQSIAYAARLFGVQATICVPEQANPVKVASMRGLGAELVFHGRDFDDAREHCERLASEHGYRYVHSGNEPLLIAGVGTETLEILEEQPHTDVIVVPVGGGSGAAGRLHRHQGDQSGDQGDRGPVGRGAGRLPLLAGSAVWSRTRWRRAPRGLPPARRSSSPSRSSGGGSTTSSS